MDDGRLDAEHVKLDYRDSTDDEEVRLLSHRRGMDEPEPPGLDICDGPNTSDTQRYKMEPLQGARPKWNIGERHPVVNDWTGVLDLEATGGVGGRNMEQHENPAPLLPLERQILQEAEVTTLPRGRAHGPGGHPEGHEQCLRFLRTSDQGTSVRTDGMMPGRRQMCWLTRLLGCNRSWRTSELRTGCCERGTGGGVPPVVCTPRQAAFTTTKVPRFGGMTSWEQYRQVFDAKVLSNGWDNETAALQLWPFWCQCLVGCRERDW